LSLPSIKLPKFETTVPSTNQKIRFVPYTNAQEKVILTASESGDETQIIKTVKETLNECYEGLEADKLTSFDIDYLFLQLRIQSVSNTSQMYFRSLNCGKTGEECEKTIKITIDLTNVKVQTYDEENNDFLPYSPEEMTANGKVIKISESVGVTVKYPGFDEQEKFSKLVDGDEDSLIKLCITGIYDDENVHTREEFDEDDLNNFEVKTF
jgi:hypothetical protein